MTRRLTTRWPRWILTGWIVAGLLAGMIGSPRAQAVESRAADAVLFAEGARALDEGLPLVAVYKLHALLQTRPAADVRHESILTLVRAQLAIPDCTAALATLDGEFPLPPTAKDARDPALVFWRGQVLAALGRWPEALAYYAFTADLPATDAVLVARAHFGRGEALLALAGNGDVRLQAQAAAVFRMLGNDPQLGSSARLRLAEIALDSHHLKEAARALGDLTSDNTAPDGATATRTLVKEHAYLVGRLRLAQRQPALAQQIFTAELAHPEGLSARLLVDNYWGWARACLDEGQPDLAQNALENLIGHYPRQEFLGPSFAWLEALYSRLPNPYLADLQNWAEDDTERPRKAYARLTLAHLEAQAGRPERAEEILEGFSVDFSDDPLRVRALLDLVALRLKLDRPKEARTTLAAARRAAGTDEYWHTSLETLDARISLAANDPARAAERFASLAQRLWTGAAAEAAAFNAALASLRAGDAERYVAARTEFGARFSQSPLAAEFPLEEGLARAEETSPADPVGRQRAIDNLRLFVYDHPKHPRVSEARIALAELAFLQGQPDIPAAERELATPDLRRASNDPADVGNPAEHDRADYLAIWLADAPGPSHDGDKAIALAKKFLEDRPDSPLAAAARMKLGEIYFGRGDNPDAQTQLELLVEKSPSSPLVEAALYLAGRAAAASRSAAGVDKAVGLFNKAGQRNGPLRLPARLRLAEVLLGKPDGAKDALVLYGEVLAATAGPAPLSEPDLDARCTALGGRGQTLLTLAATDPKFYKDAAATFDLLANGTPGAPLRWRRQALTLKGKVLEKTGDIDAALAAYDDALNALPDPAAGPADSGPEWTWFYRAGRDAASLLESQSQWTAAIAVYKKLAAADGPMKSEFETTLAKRRLEHFIWED